MFMTSMILTQVYLEATQKKALAAQAKRSGVKVSELVRDAVDAAIAGVSVQDLKSLDQGTLRAKQDIDAMLVDLKANAAEHGDFLVEMKRLQANAE
jgi:hypothetical protein